MPTKEESKELKHLRNKDIYIVVQYLNEKAGKKFSPETSETIKRINARFAEGFTVEDFKVVIDNKVRDWLHDPRMRNYLRPATLFSPSKFEGYLNEGGTSGEGDSRFQQSIRGNQGTSEFAHLDQSSTIKCDDVYDTSIF
ncbi:conserved phage C-terminal domain-containing protein [Paenibacillus yanchengensis]|uniref:Conserved phage C-terminal domain-containing protein n=2 Tax=Paenibacillus yanchengensis TaxID=2035833 RepID=A0ABW4YQZ8_9BACL